MMTIKTHGSPPIMPKKYSKTSTIKSPHPNLSIPIKTMDYINLSHNVFFNPKTFITTAVWTLTFKQSPNINKSHQKVNKDNKILPKVKRLLSICAKNVKIIRRPQNFLIENVWMPIKKILVATDKSQVIVNRASRYLETLTTHSNTI